MFLFENSRRKRVDSISFQNRHDALRDDWSTVERLIHKMNCAAAEFHTVFERLTLCIETGKRRQQAGMNVQDAVPKRLDEARRQQPHITRETNQIHAPLA